MDRLIFVFVLFIIISGLVNSQHNPGADCINCHSEFSFGGTVFSDSIGINVRANVSLKLIAPNVGEILLDPSDENGNIHSNIVPDGSYIFVLDFVRNRTWHVLPDQKRCNTCHIVGGNGSPTKVIRLPDLHTEIPADNKCTHCHHFPASMSLDRLMTRSVLNTEIPKPPIPGSQVDIISTVYPFDPDDYNITTVRPDIFAPGFYSMFDVILAVADANGISIDYYFDDNRKTHFINTINNVPGDYWYHFSYDAGGSTQNEIKFKRANRWDETLWRSGVWIQVVEGENLQEIKNEYLEEIQREDSVGHVIPSVTISINASSYMDNPPGSGRITVMHEYSDVLIAAHNLRATGYPSPYSKPFQPGVITSMDVPLSLMDQGELNAVTSVFYTYFSQHFIDSYYLVELGFPDVGSAHSSGRQGFVYVTENGTFQRLPNNAARTFHITSDISVIHSPDFSYWRWIELGNPYYENSEPTGILEESIEEDYYAIERGFNLHAPYPNPFNGTANISFNIFEPAFVEITVHDILGKRVITLFDGEVINIGIQKLIWNPADAASGIYYIFMKYKNHIQVRKLTYLK